jgi:tetratricopeptide (TPR) repeat protein
MSKNFAAALLLLILTWSAAAEQDPRDQYGTQSLDAARAFQRGLTLSNQKEFRTALAAFKQAADLDKAFELARYWMALSYGDLGDVDSAIDNYKAVIQIGKEHKVTNVTVDAAVNLALTYAKLEKNTEASRAFTEAILLDPSDQHKLHWKAYRNMSITLDAQKKHLSAAMCVVLAYQANPERVSEEMVLEFLNKVELEEVGQILHFLDEMPPVPDRAGPTQIKEAASPVEISDAIGDLLLDVSGNRIVAIVKGAPYYYLLDGTKPASAVRIKMDRPIKAGSLVAGELYLSLENPGAIARVDIASGNIQSEWKVNNVAPNSLAAMPAQGVVCFPLGGTFHTLNLADGSLKNDDFIGTAVRADPRQHYFFTYIHPGFKDTSGHVLINGRPVFFHSSAPDWAQTALFQYAVNSHQMVPAAFRLNAAANGQVLHVSADGNWVAVAGGGGWRPETPGQESGYGVAIFQARDISKMSGFFPTDAYPSGVSVNHITQHVAVWREADGRVYHMNNRKDFSKLSGPFGAASTWSADGRYLFIAGKQSGLKVFELERNTDEVAAGGAFAANLAKEYPQAIATKATPVLTLSELSNFQIHGDRPAIQALLKRIPGEGRTTKPISWDAHSPFFKSEPQKAELLKILELTRSADAGLAVFRAKEFLKKEPDHPVANHLLGIGYYATQQLSEAETAQIKAIHLDQGKTNVTIEALRMLAHLKLRQKSHPEAAYCYSYVYMLDKANPQWLTEGRPFFERADLLDLAKPVLEGGLALSNGGANDASTGESGLPHLEAAKGLKAVRPQDLYKNATNSVVLIKAGEDSGSGICVGSNAHVLTNYHVIERSPQNIQVIPFVMIGDSPKRMTAISAKVIASNQQQDIAVLQLSDAPESLVPLPVAAQDPAVGTNVYAIGSPGMGAKLLEQSMTSGIVSAIGRQIEGVSYIQHTAAVNPGNSGGPLLDETGQVIGINTLKAKLEGVSFAIPASRIREFFGKASKP